MEYRIAPWLYEYTTWGTESRALGEELKFYEDPYVMSPFDAVPVEDSHYTRLCGEAVQQQREEDIPLIVLEYAWRKMPDFGQFLQYTPSSLPPDLGSQSWQSKISPACSSTSNIGIPFSFEKYTRSGHSYHILAEENTLKSSFAPPTVSPDDQSTVHPDPLGTDVAHPIFTLNRGLYKIVDRLFSTREDEGRQGKVNWKDIITVS
jgi:hypothetical protein